MHGRVRRSSRRVASSALGQWAWAQRAHGAAGPRLHNPAHVVDPRTRGLRGRPLLLLPLLRAVLLLLLLPVRLPRTPGRQEVRQAAGHHRHVGDGVPRPPLAAQRHGLGVWEAGGREAVGRWQVGVGAVEVRDSACGGWQQVPVAQQTRPGEAGAGRAAALPAADRWGSGGQGTALTGGGPPWRRTGVPPAPSTHGPGRRKPTAGLTALPAPEVTPCSYAGPPAPCPLPAGPHLDALGRPALHPHVPRPQRQQLPLPAGQHHHVAAAPRQRSPAQAAGAGLGLGLGGPRSSRLGIQVHHLQGGGGVRGGRDVTK